MLPAALTSFSGDLGLASSSCLNKVCETICDSPPLCKGFGLSSGLDIFFFGGGMEPAGLSVSLFFFSGYLLGLRCRIFRSREFGS